MRNQGELQLTEAQRTAITKEMKDFQASAVDLRWQIEEKSAALEKLLAADRVDEKAALAQGDELMRLEERMKRAHLGLLIRVKNVLTPEQQETLRKLRSERLRGRGGPGPRAGEEPPPEPLPDDE
jgi:Spy/CpxP family protein refolding chaperone